MRLRSVVPAVLAVATALAVVPASASAAPSECSVVVPTKVVVDREVVVSPVRVASNCSWNEMEFAHWTLHHATGEHIPLTFADFRGSRSVTWYDDDAKGTWTTRPVEAHRSDGSLLTQNSATTRVKYGARLGASVTRSGTAMTWTAAASQWSGAHHRWVPRPRVRVALFHQPSGSTTWRYVTSRTTSGTGRATLGLRTPRTGTYRLVTGETPTVWASYSRPVRGRS